VCTATVTPVGLGKFFQDEDIRDEVRPCAAVFLRHAHAHQPELGQLRVELGREPVLPVPVGRVRLDLGLREVAGDGLDLALLGRQLEVHRPASLTTPSLGFGKS
jgi:hypothetical protein